MEAESLCKISEPMCSNPDICRQRHAILVSEQMPQHR